MTTDDAGCLSHDYAKERARAMLRWRLEMLIDETFFYQIKDRRRKPWPRIRKLRRELEV